MTNKALLLLDLMQRHQVDKSVNYRDGIYKVDIGGEDFDSAYNELVSKGYVNFRGFLTNQGRRFFYLTDPADLNPSLVQGIARKCLNQLAYLVSEKGWVLNEEFTTSVTNLVEAVKDSKVSEIESEIIKNRIEPEMVDVVSQTDQPELEIIEELPGEQEEEFVISPVKGKKK